MRRKTKWIIGGGVLALCTLALWAAFNIRCEYSRDKDPSGRYIAIVSYKMYLSFLPMPPGSSSDKACFVRIEGIDGTNYGEIPVPMLQLAAIEWTDTGAEIRVIGEWDFKNKRTYYWAENGNDRIYVLGEAP
jgi:hypothetical protein